MYLLISRDQICAITDLDIVAHTYCLYGSYSFDHLNERSGNIQHVIMSYSEYELFCEAGAIFAMLNVVQFMDNYDIDM